MKYIFLVLIILLPSFGHCEVGQKEKKAKEKQRIYVDALLGCSIPLGAYSETDKTIEKSGYAGTGFLFQINVDWMGKNELGVAFQYNLQYNPLKKNTINTIPYGRRDSLGPGGWTNHYLLVGPVFLKQWKKFILDVKILGGIIISSSPLFNTIEPGLGIKSGNTGVNFGYGLKVGLGYSLSKRISVMVDAGYLGGYPQIDKQYGADVIKFDTNGMAVYTPPVEIQRKRPVSTFNASAGILVKF